MSDQPLAVLPLVDVCVAGMHALAVLELEGIGADVLRHVAADLDDAVVDLALRRALQELDEVIADLRRIRARLVRNGTCGDFSVAARAGA